MAATISLVERKKFNDTQVHAVANNIWWVGYKENGNKCLHNPYLLVDGEESVLINPGSRAENHYKITRDKISSIVDISTIKSIILLHHDPERCASVSLFEGIVDRNVRIYAPSPVASSIKFYGCNHPVISLDAGDSIILKSGRTINYYKTPQLNFAGSGMLHDAASGTLFTGNIFKCKTDNWDLYAQANAWDDIALCSTECPKKAFHQTLNKIDRLLPQRICPHRGPIIEENIDKFLKAARNISFSD
ncbi:MAG: hypothetical protein KAR42_10475 [candidate division Zixibacteria bacterium]|nr:hypothetical protein [candidate division Zixibacteria bacterium]